MALPPVKQPRGEAVETAGLCWPLTPQLDIEIFIKKCQAVSWFLSVHVWVCPQHLLQQLEPFTERS